MAMNDPAASGQRDAGPEWQLLSPANQGSQGLVSEASGALNFPPRGSERDAGPEW